jgi:hypothetical protein
LLSLSHSSSQMTHKHSPVQIQSTSATIPQPNVYFAIIAKVYPHIINITAHKNVNMHQMKHYPKKCSPMAVNDKVCLQAAKCSVDRLAGLGGQGPRGLLPTKSEVHCNIPICLELELKCRVSPSTTLGNNASIHFDR